ncbi:ribosome biogenesis protein Nop16 [Vararia minispora EC-137]|uniref:Ribosome biogenesis protein Nop16 n=1 Tax=Vararia minispora EC-137 TaxID=1314806 RepID=A0ACB8QW11_9AGAM|nr:ribosome biogenesis protein Nop16 [Vararia minispora EC-137]
MANPRQRRKARSSTHSAISHSRRAKRLLKKQPPIKGPKVLQDAWDKKKTVRQNYAALGLSASLNPRISGGVESVGTNTGINPTSNSRDDAQTSGAASTSTIPKGFGKIVRDSKGKILSVEMDGDETEGDKPRASEDTLAENLITGVTPLTACWVHGVQHDPPVRTDVVQGEQASSRPAPRFSSKDEIAYLVRLVAKHQKDVEAMARDRKLNPDQRTAGELSRAIRKAGGFAKFGSL